MKKKKEAQIKLAVTWNKGGIFLTTKRRTCTVRKPQGSGFMIFYKEFSSTDNKAGGGGSFV